MNVLITICGREGSKGVKNKNIRKLLGIPLINYTIAAAYLFKKKKAKNNIDICVNSDSDIILEKVEKNKEITIIKRPEKLAKDNSPKVPVIKYSLKYMENHFNKRYDFVIDLDITSPLRKIEDIDNALNKATNNEKTDTVFSVVNSRRNPYFNMVEENEGTIHKVIESDFVARQQAPQVYDMNASIYCYRRDSLIDVLKKSPLEGKCDIILMKDTAVLDIDSEEDFILMEILAKYFFMDEFNELYSYAIKNYKN